MNRNVYILALLLLLPLFSVAQLYDISGVLKDTSGNPKADVHIEIAGDESINTLSDENGYFHFQKLPAGSYLLRFSYIGIKDVIRTVNLNSNQRINVTLTTEQININEVYVNAKVSKGLSSSSVISKEAMQLLQPSSFSDILELLPGGRSVKPSFSSVSRIDLRSAEPTSGYTTNSLGTQFNVDGMQLNSQLMLDPVSGLGLSSATMHSGKDVSMIGVDMRGISTDNIEKVEIIRGIPSVEHGNLTSSVIQIERLKGEQPWTARFRADGFSKLLSAGKGFDFKDYSLNMDLGYLKANQDVTDIFSNYTRIDGSLRGEKRWTLQNYLLSWSHNIDIKATTDNERFDPDNDVVLTDRYENPVRTYSVGNILKLTSKRTNTAFRGLQVYLNANITDNQLRMQRHVQSNTASLMLNSMEPGSKETSFVKPSYVAKLEVDNRPLDAQLKAMSNWQLRAAVTHKILSGIEYRYAKNLGLGQQYDLDMPISTNVTTRPRNFSEIPAMSNLSAFLEDRFIIPIGKINFESSLGLRASMLTNLDSRYSMSKDIMLDPRYNGRVYFPEFQAFGKSVNIHFNGGFGLQNLAPTQNMLYPALYYKGISELGYYHNNPAYRLAWANTVIMDPSNFALNAARNQKWELGFRIDVEGAYFSLNYFNEEMRNGFRSVNRFDIISYRKYDVNSIDPGSLQQKPSITDFDYSDQKEFFSYSGMENGSTTIKHGIEYEFSSKRIAGINTRFTVNGAYLKTINRNSNIIADMIPGTVITDGKVRQYLGFYYDIGSGGSRWDSRFNTNIMADSYLPKLGLSLAMNVQSLWFKSYQYALRESSPIGYLDIQGDYHVYTEQDRQDPNLRNLEKKIDPILFRRHDQPIDLIINFKATKVIKDKIRLAMFVNRLFVYKPNYQQYGNTIYRTNLAEDTPYFGMELNIKI